MEWNYQRTESKFEEIPVGEHRIRIASAEKAISKKGNDMLVLKFDVSGYNSSLWHYIVFLTETPEITNRNLTQFFDSFGIEGGNFNLASWVGKVGGCMTKEDEYGTKIKYFLSKEKQEKLPKWQSKKVSLNELEPYQDDEELPF